MHETAEKAEKDAAELHPNVKIPEVHHVPAVLLACIVIDAEVTIMDPQACRFIKERCRFCQKMGHIERVCRNKERESEKERQRGKKRRVNELDLSKREGQEEKSEGDIPLYWGVDEKGLKQWKSGRPISVKEVIEGISIWMELDTGAAVSLLPFPDYQTKFKHIPLRKTRTRLKTYTEEQVVPKGQIVVNIVKDSCKITLPLVVVEGKGPPLLGRNWLANT